MPEITDIEYARQLDREDPISHFRQEFRTCGEECIYLDGNSLGRMPLRAKSLVAEVTEKAWGDRLIRSWSEGWLDLSTRLGGKIARLIGAHEGEVLVCDATSINLYKLAMAALKYKMGRHRIISDELNFPSDLYILQGIAEQLGKPYELEILRSTDSIGIDPEQIKAALDEESALLSFTHTYFKSSFVQDMERVTSMAHKAGALILWDISHSAGSVHIDLNTCNADLAIGCTYKYLNGGPGSPAFLYVRKDLQDKLQQPVQGWLGSKNPFDFNIDYEPDRGIGRFQVGTPPILSMSALEPGLDLHLEAGISRLQTKSRLQTGYLLDLYDDWLVPLGFTLGSPRDPDKRGSHVSIRHKRAIEIAGKLISGEGMDVPVIPDFRKPDNIRLGIAPIYNSFEEVYIGMQLIKEVTEKIEESL